MTHHFSTAGVAAGISIPAALISWMATGLPAVQFLAGALSCIVSGIFLWNWLRGKK